MFIKISMHKILLYLFKNSPYTLAKIYIIWLKHNISIVKCIVQPSHIEGMKN